MTKLGLIKESYFSNLAVLYKKCCTGIIIRGCFDEDTFLIVTKCVSEDFRFSGIDTHINRFIRLQLEVGIILHKNRILDRLGTSSGYIKVETRSVHVRA